MDATVDDFVAVRILHKVAITIDLIDEAYLADRPILMLEAWHHILFTEPVRDEIELRVFGRTCRCWPRPGQIHRIWNKESSGSAEHGMAVASETLIRVVSGAQPIRVGSELWKDRIQFHQSVDRVFDGGRPVRDHGALVAG